MEIKTVTVIGLGALGVMYGHFISKRLPAGNLRVAADSGRISRYEREGVYCNGERCHFTYLPCEERGEPADLVLFCVKFGALEEAVKSSAGQIGPRTVILSVLNGITSEEYLAAAFGADKVLLCTAQGMDAVKEGCRMNFHHMGTLSVGTAPGFSSHDRLMTLCRFFDRIGLPYDVPEDIKKKMWGKLLLNTGVNQAAAVFGTNYGGLKQEGLPRRTMIAAMDEVLLAARAEGISLTERDRDEWIALVDTLDSAGIPSMRQDTLAHRPTEVELFAGTIIRLGRKHGFATPVNDFLYKRIREIEA